MIGASTIWNASGAVNGERIVKELLDLGVDGIELEYRITRDRLDEMRPFLRSEGVRVLSLHNFCPVPEILPRGTPPSGDVFLFSSQDREERRLAVRYAERTVQLAHELEARAVVFHIGRVEMDPVLPRLRALYEADRIDSEEADALRESAQTERALKYRPYLDAVRACLEPLVREAERRGVYLGLENRYFYREIPSFEELEFLLKDLHGAPVGYWHDVGHAHVSEISGWKSQQEWLERFGGALLGVHLHDSTGFDDHAPPGTGEVDFSRIRPHIPDDANRILEIRSEAEPDAIRRGIEHLRDNGVIP